MAGANHRRQHNYIVAGPGSSPMPHITLELWNSGFRKKFHRFVGSAVFVLPPQGVDSHVVDVNRASLRNVFGGDSDDLTVANYGLSFANGP